MTRPIVPLLALALLAGCDKSRSADASSADAARPLVFLTHPDNVPLSYRAADGSWTGSDVELARGIAAKMGRSLEIEGVPYETIIPRLKAGTADFGICSITITPARARDVDFSEPYAVGGSSFLYRAGERAPRMSHLATEMVAAESGTLGDIYLCRHGCDPVRFAEMKEGIDLLESGRVAAVFCDNDTLMACAKASNGRYVTSPLEMREGYGVAVNKKRPDVLAAANAVVAERRAK